MELFIMFIFMLILFIPNNGEPSLLEKIDNYFKNKETKKKSIELKGDTPTIIIMVNSHISKNNEYFGENHTFSQKPIETIDPYSTYIFHGLCHGCVTPKTESITGCMSCWAYNSTAMNLKFKDVIN